MSKLQWEFAQSVAKLILKAKELGYEVSFGDAYRTPEQATIDADAGIGILRSLHCERLAIDLNFFRDGRWIRNGTDLRDIGKWWKTLGESYRWGGDFTHISADGNHFSITPDGKRA